jgi:integrase
MVPAPDLLALGMHLMDTCAEGSHDICVATRFRDGLLVAILVSCPVRLKNLTMITIGRQLIFHDPAYQLAFGIDETKTRRPYSASLPLQLTPYVDRYLNVHRPTLASAAYGNDTAAASGALWLNRWGRPLRSAAVRNQIELRTKKAFGAPIWPHLFRDCAVTELVDVAPSEIGIAPDLLGHAGLQTTRKHYIQATGMNAHRSVQATLSDARAAARAREKERGGESKRFDRAR